MPPLAPPFLKHGKLLIAQTANILFYLGPRLRQISMSEEKQLWAHQLQLTIMDFITEIHDTHHPLAVSLYYEEQKSAAMDRSRLFLQERLPMFLEYFEYVSACNKKSDQFVVSRKCTYVDLSLFQVMTGLQYAYPLAMKRIEHKCPRLLALQEAISIRPNIREYLASERRIPFNKNGIFRHYPELDWQL